LCDLEKWSLELREAVAAFAVAFALCWLRHCFVADDRNRLALEM